MNTRRLGIFALPLLLFVLCGAPRALAQNSVTLRTAASIAEGPIVLGDVADVTGPDADALIAATLWDPATAEPAPGRVDLSLVRRAAAKTGVNPGRIAFAGSTCTLRRAEVRPQSPTPEAEERPGRRPQPVSLQGPLTYRMLIAARLADSFGVEIGDLHLLFAERDETLVNSEVGADRVDVQPTSAVASSRTPIRITAISPDGSVRVESLTVESFVERAVVIAVETVNRREVLGERHVRVERRLTAPGADAGAALEDVLGRTARNRLTPGEVIAAGDLESPVVVRRGDLVTVYCAAGAVTVTVKAQAMDSARAGETAPFRLPGRKGQFQARVSGPGRAVMIDPALADTANSEVGQ